VARLALPEPAATQAKFHFPSEASGCIRLGNVLTGVWISASYRLASHLGASYDVSLRSVLQAYISPARLSAWDIFVTALGRKRKIIMNELVQLLQEKTGLSQEMAQKVVDTVAGYLKTKLPEPMAGGLDSLLGGGAGSQEAAGATDDGDGIMDKAKSMVAGLGGMLGNKDA
jgi:hypothetical protein